MANDKMLRELEQIVEERDRLKASIESVPRHFSHLSHSAQKVRKCHCHDQRVFLAAL